MVSYNLDSTMLNKYFKKFKGGYKRDRELRSMLRRNVAVELEKLGVGHIDNDNSTFEVRALVYRTPTLEEAVMIIKEEEKRKVDLYKKWQEEKAAEDRQHSIRVQNYLTKKYGELRKLCTISEGNGVITFKCAYEDKEKVEKLLEEKGFETLHNGNCFFHYQFTCSDNRK